MNKFKANIRQYFMLIALVVVVLVFEVWTKGVLLQPLNVNNLIQQNSYILILAVGMLLVILTGNIDLSVGSVAAIAGAISAIFIVNLKMPVLPAILITLLLGVAIGCWQGFWIAYAKIPAFIVTLSGQLVFRGLTMVMLQGKTIAPFPEDYTYIAAGFLPDFMQNNTGLNGTTLGVGILCVAVFVVSQIYSRKTKQRYGLDVGSMTFFIIKVILISLVILGFAYLLAAYKGIESVLLLLAALVGIYGFITSRTIPGRYIYAYGGNAKAAQLSGISTKQVLFWVFVNMSMLAALAGIVFTGRLNAATPKAGSNFELDAIAACYIGGASSSGGIGTVGGAIIGGLIMGVLNNGMSIIGVSVDWQQVIKGLVLLFAVAFDVFAKNKAASVKAA